MFRMLAVLGLMSTVQNGGAVNPYAAPPPYIVRPNEYPAEFRNFTLPPIADLVVLDCVLMKATDRYAPDPDPVYKIVVTVAQDSGDFKAISVIHHHASGIRSDRSMQYDHAMIWQTEGKAEWFWKGYRGNGGMVGEVWANQSGWFYSEHRYERGVHAWEMVAKCHLT